MEKKVKSKKRRPVISPLSDAPKGKVAAVKAILSDRKKPQDFKNQKVSIKIPDELKKDIDTLKATEKLRYDYEVLQLLVDSYKQNLPRDRYRQFELLREIM